MSSKIGDPLFRQRLKSKLGNVFVYFSRFGQIDKSRTKRGSFFFGQKVGQYFIRHEIMFGESVMVFTICVICYS